MSLVENADSTTASTVDTPAPGGEAAATSTTTAVAAEETATETASQEPKDANVPELRRQMAGKTSTCGTFVYGGDSATLGWSGGNRLSSGSQEAA